MKFNGNIEKSTTPRSFMVDVICDIFMYNILLCYTLIPVTY